MICPGPGPAKRLSAVLDEVSHCDSIVRPPSEEHRSTDLSQFSPSAIRGGGKHGRDQRGKDAETSQGASKRAKTGRPSNARKQSRVAPTQPASTDERKVKNCFLLHKTEFVFCLPQSIFGFHNRKEALTQYFSGCRGGCAVEGVCGPTFEFPLLQAPAGSEAGHGRHDRRHGCPPPEIEAGERCTEFASVRDAVRFEGGRRGA